jgi:DNA-binding SARP family transcriptional activator
MLAGGRLRCRPLAVTVARVSLELRLLGPVEALADGRAVHLSPRPRAVLAVLALHAGQVVPAARLIDAVWADRPPETAANVLQGYVSQLRKGLGRDTVETRDPGYVLRVERDVIDLQRFERLATEGARALDDGRAEEAAASLGAGLALWRGEALADVADGDVLRPAAMRLDELRLVALERRIEAELACGRHREVVGELESLTSANPLRERPQELLMLALYRCGRQAEALDSYRATRSRLVEQLGLEPGAALRALEQAILRHDDALDRRVAPPAQPADTPIAHTIVVAPLELTATGALLEVAAPLARGGDREIVISSTVADPTDLATALAYLREHRDRLVADGVDARAAAFTSLTPGADLARVARDQDAELVLVDAPARLMEDGRLLGLLEDAPCDVAVLVDGEARTGPVFVPFTGAEHDWAAVELGAWQARARSSRLVLVGSAQSALGRDASRLLASASLAVERALAVDAEPLLVDPSPQALVDAAADAGLVVVGLTDRWRREGVGRTRTALAGSPRQPALLVRRGLRPGGLAPRTAETRFTWTIGPGVF